MNNISIRRPNEKDIHELHRFFEITITDTFEKEGLGHEQDGINIEISEKKVMLKEDLESNGLERFFLVACYQDKILGTISYGPCSRLIEDGSDGMMKGIGEIGTVYVLPEFQRKGIGTLMLNSMFIALLSRNIKEYCLDSGYTRAQKVWKKKLGEPDIVMKDYWSEGFDHMIWRRRIEDMSITYTI